MAIQSKEKTFVRPKKFLGQHFLINESIAARIADIAISEQNNPSVEYLEIGPGMGVLTQYLPKETWLCEVDSESVEYLRKNFPERNERILHKDFLNLNFHQYTKNSLVIVGNFPYHISTQIMFKILENRHQVLGVVGMFQKEVAERLAAKPGNKSYGILSVLLQAYYQVEYQFTVDASEFTPPPKVQSGVIRCVRYRKELIVAYEQLLKVVKIAFQTRRKTLRNSLKSLVGIPEELQTKYFSKRAEELSVEDFIELARYVEIK